MGGGVVLTAEQILDEGALRLRGILPEIRLAGHDVTPGHDQLHHWWVYGPGRARWKTWTDLLAQLVEEVKDKPLPTLKTWASRWFIERYGYAAGSDINRVKHGHPPRGHRIGPG